MNRITTSLSHVSRIVFNLLGMIFELIWGLLKGFYNGLVSGFLFYLTNYYRNTRANNPGIDSVLITGASHGIGSALAKVFARQGFNIILVGRDEDELQNVITEVQQINPSIKIKVFKIDLLQGSIQRLFTKIMELESFRVNHVVNNVGTMLDEDFVDSTLEQQLSMIKLNVETSVKLCHMFGRWMKEERVSKRNSREAFRIMNISSVEALCPMPRTAIYAATKAFIQSFSMALHEELAPYNIHVCALCPGLTITPLVEKAKISETWAVLLFPQSKPEDVAEVGYQLMMSNLRYTIVGRLNHLLLFTEFLPYLLSTKIAHFFKKKRDPGALGAQPSLVEKTIKIPSRNKGKSVSNVSYS